MSRKSQKTTILNIKFYRNAARFESARRKNVNYSHIIAKKRKDNARISSYNKVTGCG